MNKKAIIARLINELWEVENITISKITIEESATTFNYLKDSNPIEFISTFDDKSDVFIYEGWHEMTASELLSSNDVVSIFSSKTQENQNPMNISDIHSAILESNTLIEAANKNMAQLLTLLGESNV